MQVRYSVSQQEYKRQTTEELRESFLIGHLFKPSELELLYCEVERAIIGSAVPQKETLHLEVDKKELAADFFCQRREVGAINIGGAGIITVDENTYPMGYLDGLYIGRGSQDVSFQSHDAKHPAKFYLVSYPAHATYPTRQIKKESANVIHLGSDLQSNKRTIYQYIHNGVKSCQLVMGVTILAEGSVWNTMPAHTHRRRSEVYLYFDVPQDNLVFHLMGPADQTRHIVVADGQAAISPMWSIHSGVGTSNYSFIWGMGGENQAFDDMDHLSIGEIR